MNKDFTIRFIGEPPKNKKEYLSKLYPLLREASDGDPGEVGEEQLRKEGKMNNGNLS